MPTHEQLYHQLAARATRGMSDSAQRRVYRALELINMRNVEQNPDDPLTYLVRSQNNPRTRYLVDLTDLTCTCPDFRKGPPPPGLCKHIYATLLQIQHDRICSNSTIIRATSLKGEDELVLTGEIERSLP